MTALPEKEIYQVVNTVGSLLLLLIGWCMYFFLFREVRTLLLKQRLMSLRLSLDDETKLRGIPLDYEPYVKIRNVITAFWAIAHLLTFSSLFYLFIRSWNAPDRNSSQEDRTDLINLRDTLPSVEDDEYREFISRIFLDAMISIAFRTLGPILFPLCSLYWITKPRIERLFCRHQKNDSQEIANRKARLGLRDFIVRDHIFPLLLKGQVGVSLALGRSDADARV